MPRATLLAPERVPISVIFTLASQLMDSFDEITLFRKRRSTPHMKDGQHRDKLKHHQRMFHMSQNDKGRSQSQQHLPRHFEEVREEIYERVHMFFHRLFG